MNYEGKRSKWSFSSTICIQRTSMCHQYQNSSSSHLERPRLKRPISKHLISSHSLWATRCGRDYLVNLQEKSGQCKSKSWFNRWDREQKKRWSNFQKRKRDDIDQELKNRQSHAKTQSKSNRVGLNGWATQSFAKRTIEDKIWNNYDTKGHLVCNKDYIS